MRRLTLCFVGPAASVNLRRWVGWFAERGHDCTVLTVEPADAQRITGWRQVDLSDPARCGKWGRLISAARLAPTIARLKPDVVHVHYLRGLAWGLAASMPHPCVLTPWGSDVLPDQGAFREWYSSGLTRRLLKQADLVTAHSAYMESAVQGLVADLPRMERIGWGVDLNRFRPGLDAADLRRSLELGPNDPVILSPRLAQPLYRHELILDAMPAVLRSIPRACLVLTEYFADPDYVRRLRERTEQLGIARQVRFVGALSYADMPRWYNLASAVVMVPASDGMPNSLLKPWPAAQCRC
ncbi:MAG: glycosyltransferase [Nitrospiraceae bacterium]